MYQVHSVSCNWLLWFGNILINLSMDSPHKGPILLSFDVSFVVSLKVVEQQSSCRWFETPWPSCNVTIMWYIYATPLYCWEQLKINCDCDWLWYLGNTANQSPVNSPQKRQLTLSFDGFFVVSPNIVLKEQSSCRCCKTSPCVISYIFLSKF